MNKISILLAVLLVLVSFSGSVDASEKINIFDAEILAYHAYLLEMTPLDAQASNDGAAMPDTLIVPPSRYKAFGQTYDMTAEGLYRFFNYSDLTTIQRVVYSSDPIALISSMQWAFTQAYIENSLTSQQLFNRAKTDKLRISCGKAVEFMKWLMPQYGYPARYAGAITQQDWNYVNDGHAMIEIYLDGKWVLFDLAFNTRFWRDGEPLSLYAAASDLSTVEVEYMTIDTSYDVSGLWYQGHSLGSLFEPMMSPVLLMQYYERMMDSLIVQNGSMYYYYDAGPYDAQFQAWGYFKLTESEWKALLYP